MALPPSDITYGIASVALLALATWLLYLSPRQRAVRALAALLALMAIAFADDVIAAFLTPAQELALSPYEIVLYAGIGLSTIYFLSVYPRPRGWLGRSSGGGWAIVAALAALAVAVALFRPLVGEARIVGDTIESEPGPLSYLYNAWSLTSALLFLLLALDFRRAGPGPFRRSLVLILCGFLGGAFAWHTSLVLNDAFGRLDPGVFQNQRGRVAYLLDEIVFFPAVVAAGIVLVHGLRTTDRSARHEALGLTAVCVLVLVAVLCATFVVPSPVVGRAWTSEAQGVVDALGALALSAFATYALLKHRLFDIDVKLRWTISRGTVAGVFFAVFLVAAQLAQNFFSESLGWMMGGLVAGVMLFAIAPIQRMAERLAMTAVPVQVAQDQRRVELYRLALALALSDRAITRDEERHLAKLAEELGVTHTEALAAREAMERDMGLSRSYPVIGQEKRNGGRAEMFSC